MQRRSATRIATLRRARKIPVRGGQVCIIRRERVRIFILPEFKLLCMFDLTELTQWNDSPCMPWTQVQIFPNVRICFRAMWCMLPSGRQRSSLHWAQGVLRVSISTFVGESRKQTEGHKMEHVGLTHNTPHQNRKFFQINCFPICLDFTNFVWPFQH